MSEKLYPNTPEEQLFGIKPARPYILPLVIDLIPDDGAEIRVDGATGFQSLKKESETQGTLLHKLKIKIVIGRLINKNKNPIAENTVQEVQKEILRHTNKTGPITQTELTIVLNNINTRIRYNGYTPKEILFRRNTVNNQPIDVQDGKITHKQAQQRLSSSKSTFKAKRKSHSETPSQTFNTGDLILLRNAKDKNNPRELYIVEDREDKFFLIRKLNDMIRHRLYRALPDEMVLAPASKVRSRSPQEVTKAGRPLRRAARKAHGLVSTIRNTKKPRNTHGWLTDDQFSDEEGYFLTLSTPYISLEASPAVTSTQNSTTVKTDHDDSLDSESDHELSWDSSPEQLYATYSEDQDYNLHHALQPRNLFPDSNTARFDDEQKMLPLRRLAVSEQVITRSNAFRFPPDAGRIPPPFPRSRSEDILTTVRQVQKPRIPQPFSPSEVNLNAVTDVSYVAPLALDSDPMQDAPNATIRPRRPRNHLDYRVYHETGRKEERQERNKIT